MFFKNEKNSEFGNVDNSSNVSLFQFQITKFNYGYFSDVVGLGYNSIKEGHDIFNRMLQQTFPKLRFAQPFSTYGNAGYYSSRFITGSGETTLSESQTKAKLLDIFSRAGFWQDFTSTFEFSQKKYTQIQQGEILPKQSNPVDTGSLQRDSRIIDKINKDGVVVPATDAALRVLLGGDYEIGGMKIPKYAVYGAGLITVLMFIKR